MALPIGGKNDPQNLHRNHWETFATEQGVSSRLVLRLIVSQAERLRDNADMWLAEFQHQHGEFAALQQVQAVVKRQSNKALRDWVK